VTISFPTSGLSGGINAENELPTAAKWKVAVSDFAIDPNPRTPATQVIAKRFRAILPLRLSLVIRPIIARPSCSTALYLLFILYVPFICMRLVNARFEFAQYLVCCAAMLFRHDRMRQWNCGICDTFWRWVKR
jgi:hypothetical protein